VTFDIDANGIINVSARDKATGREQKITITASSGLSKTEIDRMVQEAEKHAAEDAKRKEEAELKNQAETAILTAEKFLRDFGDKLPEDAKKQTHERIDALRKAEESGDAEKIRAAADALNQHIQTLGGKLYEQPAGEAAPGGAAGGSQGPQGEDVVDAEFTET
jgi:molecular chaperone DnaK